MNRDISFQDKTVLLVEDELFLVEKIVRQLETLCVREVLTATNLEEAGQHMNSGPIDIALLDVNLPNGETTTEIGARFTAQSTAVVFFSGLDVSHILRVSRNHEFLEKPFSVPRLKASMLRAILRTSNFRSAQRKMAGQAARQ